MNQEWISAYFPSSQQFKRTISSSFDFCGQRKSKSTISRSWMWKAKMKHFALEYLLYQIFSHIISISPAVMAWNPPNASNKTKNGMLLDLSWSGRITPEYIFELSKTRDETIFCQTACSIKCFFFFFLTTSLMLLTNSGEHSHCNSLKQHPKKLAYKLQLIHYPFHWKRWWSPWVHD